MQLQHACSGKRQSKCVKTQLTSHASYFMNKAFKLPINDLSNFLK